MILYIAAAVATAIALPIGLLLAAKKPVPVVMSASPGGLVLLAAWFHTRQMNSIELIEWPLSRWAEVTAMRIAEVLDPVGMVAPLAAVPALVVLLGAAIGALRSTTKRWPLAAIGAALVFVMLGGIARDLLFVEFLTAPVHALGLLLLGLLACIGLVGVDDAGPEAAGAAGVGFFLFAVAAGLGAQSFHYTVLYQATATVSPEMLDALWAVGMSTVLDVGGRAWLTAGWGAAFALLGLGVASTPGGLRGGGALSAMAWIPVAALLLHQSTPDSTWRASREALNTAQRRLPGTDFQLPVSEAKQPMTPTTTLLVGQKTVRFNGARFGSLDPLIPSTRSTRSTRFDWKPAWSRPSRRSSRPSSSSRIGQTRSQGCS